MRVLVAPDSFKECLGAFEVAEAMADGLRRGVSGALEITQRPLADGGEGLLDVLCGGARGTRHTYTVTGPLGAPVDAALGLLEGGRVAVVEMARAAGLHLTRPRERNPLAATTYGVGELIRHALDLGATRIIVGLGGSATNDGGAGMAQALGVSLRDDRGRELAPGGAALAGLAEIDLSALDARLAHVEVVGACDISGTLCGPCGASRMYGPQKGASPENVVLLDDALRRYAMVMRAATGRDALTLPGGGAAGGLGAGLSVFAGAALRSGVELVFQSYGDMEERASAADFILSGEGAVDAQTLEGKVVAGVAALARRHNKPLFVLTGCVKGALDAAYAAGVSAVFPVAPRPMPEAEAIADAATHIATTSTNLARCVAALRERI